MGEEIRNKNSKFEFKYIPDHSKWIWMFLMMKGIFLLADKGRSWSCILIGSNYSQLGSFIAEYVGVAVAVRSVPRVRV